MIRVSFHDLYKVDEEFKRVLRPLENPKLRDELAEFLLTKIKRRFDSTRNEDGRIWPFTEAYRIRAGLTKKKSIRPGQTRGSDGRYHSGGKTYNASGQLSRGFVIRRRGLERFIENPVKSEIAQIYSGSPWSGMTLAEILEARFPFRHIMGIAKVDRTEMLKMVRQALKNRG